MKFDGSSGRKPSAEARRFIYQGAADLLMAAMGNGDGWLYDELDEADTRRADKALLLVVLELERKAKS